MMNKTLTNAGFNWTDEIFVHAPGWGNGFMVECLPVFELLSRYITRHDKTQQDKNEDDWNRRSDMHDSDNYRNLPQCLFISDALFFLVGMFMVIITNQTLKFKGLLS